MYCFGGATKKRVLITLLSTILMATGCGKETPQEHISNARQAIAKHDNKTAIIELKNALKQEPNNAEARALLGNAYVDSGDALSAEKELRQATKLGAKKANILPGLGQALLMQGKHKEVLDEIQLDAGLDAAQASEVLAVRGNALMSLGQPDQARASFNQALQKFPDNADVYLGLASLSVAAKDLPEAHRQIDLALQKEPKKVAAMQFKGDLLRYQGKHDQALDIYRKIISNDSRNISARLAAATLLMETGKMDEARGEVETAYSIAKNSPLVNYTKALLDYQQKQYKAAQDALLVVLKNNPDHISSILLMGRVETALGSFMQAETRFNRVLALQHDNEMAMTQLALMWLAMNNPQKAEQAIAPMVAKGQQDAQLLAMLGEINAKKGQYNKASEYFEKAAKLLPQNPGVQTALGMSQLASGKSEAGLRHLEAASELDPAQYRADILLVQYYLNRKEFDHALTAAAKLQVKQPKNPLSYNLVGGAYLGKKEPVKARQSFEQALKVDPVFIPAALNLARLDIQDKRPNDAIKRFEGVLEKDANNIEAMLALSELFVLQGKTSDALKLLERAVETKPDNLNANISLIQHYARAGDLKKAVNVARQAKNADNKSPKLLELLAQTQLQAKDLAGALDSYKELAVLLPDSPEVFVKLAGVYARKNDQVSAVSTLDKVIRLKPDYLPAQIALASLHQQAGKTDEAVKIAKSLQQKYPKSASGFMLEGDILLFKKEFNKAAALYDRAYGINQGSELAIRSHAAWSNAGNAANAERRIRDWLRSHPSDDKARGYLAQFYQRAGQIKAAVIENEIIVKQQPRNAVALNNLALLYQTLADPRAIGIAEQAYQLGKNSPAILDTLGWLLVSSAKDLKRGTDMLGQAVGFAPDQPEISYHYGAALAKSGDKEGARKHLNNALKTGQTFSWTVQAKEILKKL